MDTTTETKQAYENANFHLKVQAIITIIFAAIGGMIGFGVYMLLNAFSGISGSKAGFSDYLAFNLFVIFSFTLPNLYFIISGILLLRSPPPKVAKSLSIANIVVGAFTNIVIMIVAIISLAKSADYEQKYNALDAERSNLNTV